MKQFNKSVLNGELKPIGGFGNDGGLMDKGVFGFMNRDGFKN